MPHSTAPSLYRSPQEAMQAPPEEFLYLACLREGTGVDAPDFLAVVDTEDEFVPAGAVTVTAFAIAGRRLLSRMKRR